MHVNQLSTEEQRELASCIAPDTEKCSAVQRAKYAELRLEQLAETKDKELSLYTQLIENLVFLLWRHVQYYTVYCKDPTEGIGGEPLPKKLLSSNQDYIKNVRFLSGGMIYIINENIFLMQLTAFVNLTSLIEGF